MGGGGGGGEAKMNKCHRKSTAPHPAERGKEDTEKCQEGTAPNPGLGPLEGSVHSSLTHAKNQKCKTSWSLPPRTKGGWCILVTADFWQISGFRSWTACKVPSSKLEATHSKGNKDHIYRGDGETWEPLASS